MTLFDWFLLFHLTSPLILWVLFYLLYNRMPKYTQVSSGPWYWWIVGVFGVFYDLYVNFTWGTLIFLQLPNINRGFLSARMDDLIRLGTGWRQQLAVKIVGSLLEPYDLSTPRQHNTYGLYK